MDSGLKGGLDSGFNNGLHKKIGLELIAAAKVLTFFDAISLEYSSPVHY